MKYKRIAFLLILMMGTVVFMTAVNPNERVSEKGELIDLEQK